LAELEVRGRNVLLTGATGGLGRAIATAFASEGAELILSARDAGALEALKDELPGDNHTTITADLAEPGGASRLAHESGNPDVLVANAGLPATGQLGDLSPTEVSRALRVNLESPIIMARELVGLMKERGAGNLVFISSLGGKTPSAYTAVYNATKFGLRGFALALRADLAGSGVGVSVVSPGFVREAGMLADSGAGPPPGMGTATPRQVAAAVLRAIKRNRVEVAVAPRRQRFLAHLSLALPRMGLRATARGPGRRAVKAMAEGQRDKR
jgi:short-subunit dehydrogenase